jgi:type IV pilus assembly protein PilN
MRITLNLASRPFVELRPLYARMRLWMAILAVLALPVWYLMHLEQRHAAEANAHVHQLEANILKLEQQQARFQALMREPQNAAILSQSEFLNRLFQRKAFSWTAIMMDLEDVLPSGVQVMNIDPSTAPDGRVTIRLRVDGPRDHAVDLVRNLEHSRRFLSPRLADEAAATAAGGQAAAAAMPVSASSDVNFDILAEYNPLPRTTLEAAPPPQGTPVVKTIEAHKPAKTPGPAKKRSPSAPSARPAPTGGAR